MKTTSVLGIGAAGFILSCSMAIVGAAQGPPGAVTPPEEDASRVKSGFDYAQSQGITLDL